MLRFFETANIFNSQLMDRFMKAAFLGLSSVGVGSALYYLLREQEEEPEVQPVPNYRVKSVIAEVRVPTLRVGILVGRNGCHISTLEEETDTKIYFKDARNTQDFKICVIRGSPTSVALAQKELYDKILKYPTMDTVEIFIPMRTFCSLVRRYGQNLNWIQDVTHTTVILDNWSFHNNYSTRKVFLIGHKSDIEGAKNFLAQVIEDDEEKLPCTPNGFLPIPTRTTALYVNSDDRPYSLVVPMDVLFDTGNNELLEVYVASIESPEKFWIQIMGPSVLSIDQFAEDMTQFYSKLRNQRSHKLTDIKPGKLIAIPNQYDGRWHRAEIRSAFVDRYDDNETVLNVFYVDYGDVGSFRKKEAFELNEKFVKMRYQAIQCVLANISHRDHWPQEAITMFANMTCSGRWRTMSAKIIDFKCPRVIDSGRVAPIPCLQLIDTTHEVYLDVAYELVSSGHAEWLHHLDVPD